MYVHLYAIVEQLPPAWRPPSLSPEPSPAVTRVAELAVVASPVRRMPEPTTRALARHHEVVASTLEAGAVLPCRFGTLVPAADLADWVGARLPILRAGLAQVRGCVEMDVKLLHLHGARDAEGARPEDPPDAAALRALGDRLVDLSDVARWRFRCSGAAGNVAASVAFLVPRREVAAFLSRIAPVASRAEGVAVVPTGPWPPYSFVPPLDRPSLAQVAEAQTGRALPPRTVSG